MTLHIPPCGCRTVEIVANRADRRRLKKLTGRAPSVLRAHADGCPFGGANPPRRAEPKQSGARINPKEDKP